MAILNDDPRNDLAWLWMSGVVPDPRRKQQCLETVLELNPHDKSAKGGLLRLEALEMVTAEQDQRPAQEMQAPDTPKMASPFLAPAPAQAALEHSRGTNGSIYIIDGIMLLCL